jgi:hypothetical protein
VSGGFEHINEDMERLSRFEAVTINKVDTEWFDKKTKVPETKDSQTTASSRLMKRKGS